MQRLNVPLGGEINKVAEGACDVCVARADRPDQADSPRQELHFWYKRAPDGVEIVPTFVGFRRSDRQTFENAFERIEQIADDLKAVGCNIVALSGTPPVLLK